LYPTARYGGCRPSADWGISPFPEHTVEENIVADRKVEITVGNETHTAHITTYKDGSNNLAIQTFDYEGIPYCRVTTNPGYKLKDDVVALRDDYEMVIGETRDALVTAGVIEMLQPQQHISIGYTTGKLYRVLD
jgi:hypothetical protein